MNSTFIESVNATNVEASRGNLENLDPQTNPVTQSNYPNMTIIPSLNATLSELNKSIEMNNTQKNYIKRDYKLTEKIELNLWLESLRSEYVATIPRQLKIRKWRAVGN